MDIFLLFGLSFCLNPAQHTYFKRIWCRKKICICVEARPAYLSIKRLSLLCYWSFTKEYSNYQVKFKVFNQSLKQLTQYIIISNYNIINIQLLKGSNIFTKICNFCKVAMVVQWSLLWTFTPEIRVQFPVPTATFF